MTCIAFPIRISGTKAARTATVTLRARMSAIVDPAKAAAVDVRVDLRRRERAVAEELLDHAQVSAALEQVRGERVTELVRVRGQAAERRGVEPAAARGEEDGVLRTHRELWSPFPEVQREPVRGLLAEGDRALLAALAADVQELLLEVNVLEV